MSRIALSLEAISKTFFIRPVLKDVTFQIPEGAIGGLIGPNGAGKTTLFSIIAGFLKADLGEVLFFGRPTRDISSLSGLLSILPQDAQFQRGISLERHFYWYAKMMGFDHDNARKEVRRVLDWVGLAEEAIQSGGQLSHGMHKRMAIAQALIGSPKVILLDEPTAGLDPANAHRIRELIRRLRDKRTILVSSHNLDEISDICDHITIIDKGEIVKSGAMESFTQEEHGQSKLSFNLLKTPSEDFLTRLRSLNGIHDVALSEDGRILACSTAHQFLDNPRHLSDVLALMASSKVDFSEMYKGAKLEETFLALTQ